MAGIKILSGRGNLMSNVVIIGGGAAGWMTAIYAKHIYPESKVTVVASEEIGILGAGESTTPMFVDFLDIVKIPFYELIKNCGASIKVAAKFSNWDKDGNYYYNSFSGEEELAISELNSFIDPVNQYHSRAMVYSIGKNDKQSEFDLNSALADNNTFPFSLNGSRIGHFSLNFDARLAADYFKKVATEDRGVLYINDEVTSFDSDNDGNIIKINCKNNIIDSDFVFDCSGFKRLLIGRHYNSEWKSYSENLPADKAFPFFLSHDQVGKPVVPYTNAVAMKYGWMWITPLQHRYGCGYVFDSSYISVEDAKKEVEEYFGFQVDPPKPGLFFEFNPGMYKKVWIKNCIAMGLSAGFIEPMEATAILSNLHSLKKLPNNINDLINSDQNSKDIFNKQYELEQEEILSFIYLHYVTNREDTLFWKDFTKKNKMTKFIEGILEKNKDSMLEYKDFEDTKMFALENYLFVLQGNGILNLNPYLNEFKDTYSDEENKNYELFKIKKNLALQTSADWQEMLNMIEEQYDAVK
jgi:tryptophan halogenase